MLILYAALQCLKCVFASKSAKGIALKTKFLVFLALS